MSRISRLTNRFIVLVLAAFVAACSTPTLPPATDQTATPDSMTLTVTGEIQEINASRSVIILKQTLEGIDSILPTEKTAITGADNQPLSLAQLGPGMTVEATGTTNGAGAINAVRIRVTRMAPIAR
ncbi:MAG: hypothetical protein WCF84_09785 [Anaerolineae bacterium]